MEAFIYLLNGIYYGYIYNLMINKRYSGYKCCYIFGFINTFLIVIIYITATYAPCNIDFLCEGDEHLDNIYSLFQDVEIREVLILISYTILCGLDYLLAIKIMFEFTPYHILIIFHIQQFINSSWEKIDLKNIFFILEFIFILIFLEILELNFCGLNINLRKNIEQRAIIDTQLNAAESSETFDLTPE